MLYFKIVENWFFLNYDPIKLVFKRNNYMFFLGDLYSFWLREENPPTRNGQRKILPLFLKKFFSILSFKIIGLSNILN